MRYVSVFVVDLGTGYGQAGGLRKAAVAHCLAHWHKFSDAVLRAASPAFLSVHLSFADNEARLAAAVWSCCCNSSLQALTPLAAASCATCAQVAFLPYFVLVLVTG